MVLVHHHIKYKEIHGVDEVVLMEHGEHRRLHARLRREGKCNIPAPVLRRISDKANDRRPEEKERAREYHAEWYAENKERMREYYAKRYAEDPTVRERMREYYAKWYAENKERVREYKARTHTIFPRLRPDIISSAMTPD